MIKEFIKDERGIVHWFTIFGVAVIIAISLVLAIIDYIYIQETKKRAHNTIDEVNRSIYSLIDIENVAFNVDIEVLDEQQARSLFQQELNLRFNIGSDNSFVDGNVFIDQFHVVKTSDLPFNDGYNNIMQEPGIVSEVRIPIKTPLLGLQGEYPILVTSGVFRLIQE